MGILFGPGLWMCSAPCLLFQGQICQAVIPGSSHIEYTQMCSISQLL